MTPRTATQTWFRDRIDRLEGDWIDLAIEEIQSRNTWSPIWHAFVVGFGAGMLVAFFLERTLL